MMRKFMAAVAAAGITAAEAQKGFTEFGRVFSGGVLECPGVLGDDAIKHLKDSFEVWKHDAKNAHRPMIIGERNPEVFIPVKKSGKPTNCEGCGARGRGGVSCDYCGGPV